MEKQFCFDYEHYAALSELSEADRRLVAEAERATANAHAPYSNFHVVDVERRQGSPMRVLMSGHGTVTAVDSASKLLPFTFIL